MPKPTPAFAKPIPIPVPVAGIDAIASLSNMQPTEAIYAYNLISESSGLQVRPGEVQWVTNMLGAGGVRTIIPVRGNSTSGAQDHLFACTIEGIWDCTASSAAPTKVVTFPNPTGLAGWGQWDHCTNIGGDVILMYCDEVNGYYTFDTGTNTWLKVTASFAGQAIQTASSNIMTVSSVTSGVLQVGSVIAGVGVDPDLTIIAMAPTGSLTGTGGDGTYQVSTTTGFASTAVTAVGPSQIAGVDPATFVGVRLFNNRVWFVEGGTGNAWYLPVGQVYGAVTTFEFGNLFPHGGNLNSLWVFTYGSYFGMYIYLVGISDAGDIIAYTGADPESAATWSLAGQWYIGDIIPGRRCASNYGGDLNILCNFGIIALSSLFYQKDLTDPNSFLTKKIAPAIRNEIAQNQVRGWEIVPWPAGGSLLVLDPGPYNQQYCYSLQTNGWTIFRGLDMQTAVVWHGNLYFGDANGTMWELTGGQDNVELDGAGGVSIQWGMLGAFSSLGAPGVEKFVDLIRPYFVASGQITFNIFARFDFNISDLILGSGVAAPPASATGWDSGIWDSAIWGEGAETPLNQVTGTTGCGRWCAVGLLGASNGLTTLVALEASVRPTKGFL